MSCQDTRPDFPAVSHAQDTMHGFNTDDDEPNKKRTKKQYRFLTTCHALLNEQTSLITELESRLIELSKLNENYKREVDELNLANNKFGYYLPYYRMQDIFASSGWTPSRSTLDNIIDGVEFIVQPLLDLMWKRVLSPRRTPRPG